MTDKILPFEQYSSEYDLWYEQETFIYQTELKALLELFPTVSEAIEIGVGTARFAQPLKINYGIDPASAMLKIACSRLPFLVKGKAENLPFAKESFELALMITTICFLDNLEKAFAEIQRILKPKGWLLLGFIDRESELGRFYQRKKAQSKFYAPARFFSVPEIVSYLEEAGFGDFEFRQTLFISPTQKILSPQPIEKGWGRAGFIVLRSKKL